jgi:hypothetical protein
MPIEAPVLSTADDLTAAWLQAALGTGPIAGFRPEQISTGQMSRNHRVSIDYESDADDGPSSVVLKTASPHETSRGTGLRLGIYEREIRFYREEVGQDGLITAARIGLDDLQLEVDPLAFGPLRLEAPDGRVSEFPRAMCNVRDRDGRTGVAWVEWNRNRSLT